MFSITFLALFLLSFLGIVYLVFGKRAVLARIPEESLANQETFAWWVVRMARGIAHVLNPKRIRLRFLTSVAHALNAARAFFSRIHHGVETMAKTARERSQKMDWEHRWYPPEELKREGQEDVKKTDA